MKTCIVADKEKTIIIDVPVPQINDDEVLIKVKVCGMCASELHIWENGYGAGSYRLGHEAVGIIEAVGTNVKGFTIGDRVTGMMLNSFAEYTKESFKSIVKVPEKVRDEEAFGEPLSCLLCGAERTTVHFGDSVAIVGMGFMGLGFMQLMKLKGAASVIAIDIRQEGLEHALHFGADEALLPREAAEIYNVVEWGQMGRGVNVAVEASGSQKGLECAGNITGVHGIMSVVGYHQDGLRSVDIGLWNWKAITVINAHERRNEYHIAGMKAGLDMIAKGAFNMKDMITHEFSMKELDQAFRALKDKEKGYIKSYIRIA